MGFPPGLWDARWLRIQNIKYRVRVWDQVSGCYAFLRLVLSCVRLLQSHGLQSARFLCPWDSSGKNTGVGCHFLLQEIFPTQGLNPCLRCLLRWWGESLPLSHLGSRACFSRSVNQSVFSSLKSRGCAKQPLRHHPIPASWNLKPKEAFGCWMFIIYTGCHAAWVHGVSRWISSSWQSSSLDETALFPHYSGQRGSWHFFPWKESWYFSVLSLDTQQERLPYSSWWACQAAILSEAQKNTDSPLRSPGS